ncbi:MAG: hypothetical protein IJ766_03245 [Clostridia bacterium]|nr:hypothetical protein [Clostridia bacterium]
MSKIQTFLRRMDMGSLRRMQRNIDTVHRESGKAKAAIFCDMVNCMLFKGFGHLDYLTFGFVYNKGAKRDTFMTMNDNIALVQQLNDRAYYHVFNNKLDFNKTFTPFLGRTYIDLHDGFDAFAAFVGKNPVFFAKRAESFGGEGVKKVTVATGTDLQTLYASLIDDNFTLAEEAIRQHPEMNKLCDRSVNTIRIVTVVADDGTPRHVYSLVRVGSGKNDVDNISSGGMYTLLDENGRINFPMFCDKTVSYYDKHPQNGFVFKGFQIPYYKEAVDLCLKAALVEPHMRYIGWDVAITPDGPALVEGNNLPGYDMCQNHRFHADGMGMKPAFAAALKNSDK